MLYPSDGIILLCGGEGQTVDAESVVVVARGWGEGTGRQCLMGTELQFGMMKRVTG